MLVLVPAYRARFRLPHSLGALREFDTQAFDLPPESSLMNAQFLCCSHPVPAMPSKSIDNESGHQFIQGHWRGDLGPLGTEMVRKMLRENEPTSAQNKGVFYDIFQFPHIAREIVFHKDVQYRRRNSGNVFTS